MTIVDFFDPQDILHLRAWWFLRSEGYFPREFKETVPEGVEWPTHWQTAIAVKMAEAWVLQKLRS